MVESHRKVLGQRIQRRKARIDLPNEPDEILSLDEPQFKSAVVSLILTKDTERAVAVVSRRFKVRIPTLLIAHSKGKKLALAVYHVSSNSIAFSDQDHFFNPFVVLHEMYHAIRSSSGHHRGTERNADKFALDYIEQYKLQMIASGISGHFELSVPSNVD
jgi:hypothetical protein